MLELPLRWKAPKRIFVNSMSDLFPVDIPLLYIEDVFDVMRRGTGFSSRFSPSVPSELKK